MVEEELNNICKQLKVSNKDHWRYERDAKIIENAIIDEMKKQSVEFKSFFKGTYVTGSYLDDLKIRKTHEFDYFIVLALPVVVIPERLLENPGLIRLRVKNEHKFAENGFVQRHRVHTWMRDILRNALSSEIPIKTIGGSYNLKYVAQGHNEAHMIEAVHAQNPKRKILYDFIPVIEFCASRWCLPRKLQNCDINWYAAPLKRRHREYNQEAFKVCAPHWEQKVLTNKMNLNKSLRLIKIIRDTTDMTQLTSYMLKSAFLIEVDLANDVFWHKPVGEITLHMLRQLLKYLCDSNLPFYWDRNHNLIRYIDASTLRKYVEKLEYAIIAVEGGQYNRPRLRELFGLH